MHDILHICICICKYVIQQPLRVPDKIMFNSKPYSMSVSVPEAIGGQDESVLEFSSQIPSQAKTVPRNEHTGSAYIYMYVDE